MRAFSLQNRELSLLEAIAEPSRAAQTDLPHGDFKGVFCGREVTRRGEHANAPFDKGSDSGFLDDELSGEARRILNEDRSDAVAFDPIQQR
jgi:hypothetical protein